MAKFLIFSKLKIGLQIKELKNTELMSNPIFFKKKWPKVLVFDKNLTKQQAHFLSQYWIDLNFSSFYQYTDTTNSGLYLVSHVNHVIGDQ